MHKRNYNPLDKQSQEKLRIYSKYLRVYLSIMLNSGYNNIGIYDMFAGMGVYDKEAKGSAILAFDIIKEFREKHKHIYLYLNDNDEECYQSLRFHTQADVNRWVKCTSMEADDAIAMYTKQGDHKAKLFYLDPYGYIQIKKSSINAIIVDSKSKNECFWFIPVTRIVQFFRKGKPISEQESSVAEFFREHEIDISDFQDAGWHQWGQVLKESLEVAFYPSYVGVVKLKTRLANYYALYFISNHIYGLDVFLHNAKSKKDISTQLGLLSKDADELNIQSYLMEDSEGKSNKQLYERALRKGIIPRMAGKILQTMKDRKEISIHPFLEGNPVRGLYLSWGNYKQSPKIKVKWNFNGD